MIKGLVLAGALLTSTVMPATIANDKEFDCLAKNVYYEARTESLEGQIAVALVTLNRQLSDKFPDTICKVVHQKGQFSWTSTKKSKRIDFNQYSQAILASKLALENPEILGKFDALYFHNLKINPGWKLKKVAKIGNHKFYK